jgi:hypothetical protein
MNIVMTGLPTSGIGKSRAGARVARWSYNTVGELMRLKALVIVLAVAIPVVSYADSSRDVERDKAIKKINACLKRNEVSSRECKRLNKNVQTLVEVYKAGDKSVLPLLLRFAYLGDFYGDALLEDPDGFLTAMGELPQENLQAVARILANGARGAPSRERFEEIRKVLTSIPETSPTKATAQFCLKAVETANAVLFVTYFPPDAFTGRDAERRVSGYSSAFYGLGQKPLWPPSSQVETSYRFTYLGAFTGSKVVTVTAQADGTARIEAKDGLDTKHHDESRTVGADRLAEFLGRVNKAHFWEMPTELPSLGLDGADWILEGVQDGRYHVVVRWCPDINRYYKDKAFADAARFMFDLAGQKQRGGC